MERHERLAEIDVEELADIDDDMELSTSILNYGDVS